MVDTSEGGRLGQVVGRLLHPLRDVDDRRVIYERHLERAWHIAKMHLEREVRIGKNRYADDVYKCMRYTVHELAERLTIEEQQRFVATYLEPQHRSRGDRFHYCDCQSCRDYGLWNEPRFSCPTWVTNAYQQLLIRAMIRSFEEQTAYDRRHGAPIKREREPRPALDYRSGNGGAG